MAQPNRNDQNLRVGLDLNTPSFLRSWFALEKSEKVRVLNTLEKINQLTWAQVYGDQGLKWEAIEKSPVPLPAGVSSVYSLRITQARRAIACRDGQMIRFIWIAPDHDSTYTGNKR